MSRMLLVFRQIFLWQKLPKLEDSSKQNEMKIPICFSVYAKHTLQVSGWYFFASPKYAFLMADGEASFTTPSIS